MIHDIFLLRYPQNIYHGDQPTDAVHQIFVQAAHIIFGDLGPKLKLDQLFFQNVHDALARELGRGRLNSASTYDAACGQFLVEPYDLWNDSHSTADTFLKVRLSLVELLFRAAEERATLQSASAGASSLFSRASGRAAADSSAAVTDAVRELNHRFHQCGELR
jgi:hypothetical protein